MRHEEWRGGKDAAGGQRGGLLVPLLKLLLCPTFCSCCS
jgi:hypothetical protein